MMVPSHYIVVAFLIFILSFEAYSQNIKKALVDTVSPERNYALLDKGTVGGFFEEEFACFSKSSIPKNVKDFASCGIIVLSSRYESIVILDAWGKVEKNYYAFPVSRKKAQYVLRTIRPKVDLRAKEATGPVVSLLNQDRSLLLFTNRGIPTLSRGTEACVLNFKKEAIFCEKVARSQLRFSTLPVPAEFREQVMPGLSVEIKFEKEGSSATDGLQSSDYESEMISLSKTYEQQILSLKSESPWSFGGGAELLLDSPITYPLPSWRPLLADGSQRGSPFNTVVGSESSPHLAYHLGIRYDKLNSLVYEVLLSIGHPPDQSRTTQADEFLLERLTRIEKSQRYMKLELQSPFALFQFGKIDLSWFPKVSYTRFEQTLRVSTTDRDGASIPATNALERADWVGIGVGASLGWQSYGVYGKLSFGVEKPLFALFQKRNVSVFPTDSDIDVDLMRAELDSFWQADTPLSITIGASIWDRAPRGILGLVSSKKKKVIKRKKPKLKKRKKLEKTSNRPSTKSS